MLYPIAIEPGDANHSFGVIVPDIPGCNSSGETLEEAVACAKDAIESHLWLLVDDNEEIPEATSIEKHAAAPEYEGCVWRTVEVDVTQYSKLG